MMKEPDFCMSGDAGRSATAATGHGEFLALLRLLDDDTPEVRAALERKFAEMDGDASEWIGACGVDPDEGRLKLLSSMLAPGRRRRLAEEWQAPTGGAAAMGDDWDLLESLLRNLSDFLHDGVTIRQPLSDALDMLSEEAEDAGVDTEEDLRIFLFEEARYVANESAMEDPENLDLAWVVDAGRGNAVGLCVLYVLIANRLGLEVVAVDYPQRFFCRIHEQGRAYLIDCADFGRPHLQQDLMGRADIGRIEKRYLGGQTGPGGVLLRVMSDLETMLRRRKRAEDADLIKKLRGLL